MPEWKNSYSVINAAEELGIRRTKLLELVAEGKLKAKKIDKATVITGESLAAYFASLPDANITLPAHQKEKQAREAKREPTLESLGLV